MEQRETKYNSDRERRGESSKIDAGDTLKGAEDFTDKKASIGITLRQNAPQSQDIQPYKDEKISIHLQ